MICKKSFRTAKLAICRQSVKRNVDEIGACRLSFREKNYRLLTTIIFNSSNNYSLFSLMFAELFIVNFFSMEMLELAEKFISHSKHNI